MIDLCMALLGEVHAAVQRLTTDVGEQGGARGMRTPKGVLNAYWETYHVLLRYCQVVSVDKLAPIWSCLARCAKGKQQLVLQQEMTGVCVARGLTPNLCCPAVTTRLK